MAALVINCYAQSHDLNQYALILQTKNLFCKQPILHDSKIDNEDSRSVAVLIALNVPTTFKKKFKNFYPITVVFLLMIAPIKPFIKFSLWDLLIRNS